MTNHLIVHIQSQKYVETIHMNNENLKPKPKLIDYGTKNEVVIIKFNILLDLCLFLKLCPPHLGFTWALTQSCSPVWFFFLWVSSHLNFDIFIISNQLLALEDFKTSQCFVLLPGCLICNALRKLLHPTWVSRSNATNAANLNLQRPILIQNLWINTWCFSHTSHVEMFFFFSWFSWE